MDRPQAPRVNCSKLITPRSPEYVYWMHPADYDAAVRAILTAPPDGVTQRARVVPAIIVAAIVPAPRDGRASGARRGLHAPRRRHHADGRAVRRTTLAGL
jgi:hypothetical protein